MASLPIPRASLITAAAFAGFALACAGVFLVLVRNEPEVPRNVTVFLTLLYGLLLGAVLLVARKLRRSGAPRHEALDFYLAVGAVLLIGVGVPLYGLVRTLLG
jgi:hypothetical protein